MHSILGLNPCVKLSLGPNLGATEKVSVWPSTTAYSRKLAQLHDTRRMVMLFLDLVMTAYR